MLRKLLRQTRWVAAPLKRFGGASCIIAARASRLLPRHHPPRLVRIAALGGALVAVPVLAGAGWWLFAARSPAALSSADESPVITVRLSSPPAPRPDHAVEFRDGCTSAECHAALSSTYATLAARIHAPVAEHACDQCHAPDAGGHIFPLLKQGSGLCTQCHSDAQVGGHARFQHRAIIDGGCTACHDPHASTGPALLVGATVAQTCATCHPATPGGHRHWPYAAGQCDSCHQPHGSDLPALLRTTDAGPAGLLTPVTAIEAHCGLCHEQVSRSMAAAPHSHREAERSCLGCHSAHASNWKGLQKLEPRLGCITCHEDVATTVAGARVSHDAVLKHDQCISCHEPHASASAMMLRNDHGPVCLSCHSAPVIAADGRAIPAMASMLDKPLVHGAALVNCAGCHSVHGGQHARLLKAINPKVLLGGFDIRNYALCFSCHDPELALSDRREATAFRHGDVNLHRVHLQANRAGTHGELVEGERSRSCAACHAVHSSDLPRLIAESVAYDGSAWMMPMGFYLTSEGGGCAPGCHEPLEYSRRPAQRGP
jgi:predicted CXXCH cytochrome family protein